MRKVVDLMAVVGFLLSTSMAAALVISFFQFNNYMDESMERIGGQVTEKIEEQLKKKVGGFPGPTFY